MAKHLKVGVVFGGCSGEHEVSLMSARSIIRAMDRSRYEVVPIGITRSGRWLLVPEPDGGLKPARVEDDSGVPVSVSPDPEGQGLVLHSQEGPGPRLDVVFPVLHGPYGEDGTIQGFMEMAGMPYVGAGVAASAVGMDKALMKAVFQQAGLPVVRYASFLRIDWVRAPERVMQRVEEGIGYPCFVKPANLGSSVGVSKVRDREELSRGISLACEYDRKFLVEEAVDAREVECSVLGNDDPRASVCGEIIPCNEFYDYNAKYVDEGSKLLIPAPLPSHISDRVRELAIRAFQAIDCSGMARVDFFVTKEANQVLVNEINTIPGFTHISMYPKLWEASGLPYPQLIDTLIQLALERHEEKRLLKAEP